METLCRCCLNTVARPKGGKLTGSVLIVVVHNIHRWNDMNVSNIYVDFCYKISNLFKA